MQAPSALIALLFYTPWLSFFSTFLKTDPAPKQHELAIRFFIVVFQQLSPQSKGKVFQKLRPALLKAAQDVQNSQVGHLERKVERH